jgi:hypothetical protein
MSLISTCKKYFSYIFYLNWYICALYLIHILFCLLVISRYFILLFYYSMIIFSLLYLHYFIILFSIMSTVSLGLTFGVTFGLTLLTHVITLRVLPILCDIFTSPIIIYFCSNISLRGNLSGSFNRRIPLAIYLSEELHLGLLYLVSCKIDIAAKLDFLYRLYIFCSTEVNISERLDKTSFLQNPYSFKALVLMNLN